MAHKNRYHWFQTLPVMQLQFMQQEQTSNPVMYEGFMAGGGVAAGIGQLTTTEVENFSQLSRRN